MKLNLAHRALLIMALFSACTENAIQLETAKQDTPANNRTLEEILDIAKNAPTTFEENDTRSAQTSKEIDMSSLKAIPNKSATRSGGSSDPSLYVINYTNNEGYIMISAKEGTPGVMAYIDEGQYNMDDIMNSSTDIGYFTDLATAYVASLPLIPVQPGNPDTTVFRIDKLLSTTWGQRDPEGIYCSNGYSGCTNTAMAQILAYFEYPDTIQLTYSGASQSTLVLDWVDIKKHFGTHSPLSITGCQASEEAHSQIAHLCRQLGELNNSSYYTSGGTGTSPHNVPHTVIELGYRFSPTNVSQDWRTFNDEEIIDALTDGHPVLLRGSDTNAGGHCWTGDGLIQYTYTSEIPRADGGYDLDIRKETYLHMNYGWNGNCNGYFKSGVFKPNNPKQYDLVIGGHSGGNYNFNNNPQHMEIYPNR